MREDHGQKSAALAGPVAGLEDAAGGGAAMMAIGNVKAGNGGELALDELDLGVGGEVPGGVADAIGGGEIDGGGLGDFLGHKGVHRRGGAVGEEDGAGLGVQGLDVADAVVFFVGPGELMFFDDVGEIFGAAGGGDEADLGVFAHDLAVEIESGLGILAEGALADKVAEIFEALGVDGG